MLLLLIWMIIVNMSNMTNDVSLHVVCVAVSCQTTLSLPVGLDMEKILGTSFRISEYCGACSLLMSV